VVNGPVGALANLGLARAYALPGDAAKTKAAYQDFLNYRKMPDPDIPILRQAKAEYPATVSDSIRHRSAFFVVSAIMGEPK
jgi:hypothetical protein